MEERTLPKPELEALLDRVGCARKKRMEWALKFAQRDAPVTSGDRENLRQELSLFIRLLGSPDIRPPRELPDDLSHFFEEEELELLEWNEVRTIMRTFRRVLDEVESAGSVDIGPFRVSYTFALPAPLSIRLYSRAPARVRHAQENAARRWQNRERTEHKDFGSSISAPPRGLPQTGSGLRISHESHPRRALMAFADLLVEHEDSLRKCPDRDCGTWFLAPRSNKEYCKDACKWRSAQRAHRERLSVRSRKAKRKAGHP